MIRSAASRRTGVVMIGVGIALVAGCSMDGAAPPSTGTDVSVEGPAERQGGSAGAPASEGRPTSAAASPAPPSLPPLGVAARAERDVGGMTGTSSFEPVAILRDADPSAMLLVGNDSVAGPTMRRCKNDGSTCEGIPLAVDHIAAATFDRATKKILVVNDAALLRACDVDGTGCAPSAVPGAEPWSLGALVFDPASNRIIRRGCGHLERCAPDGSGCAPMTATIAPPIEPGRCSSWFDLTFDAASQKLVAAAAGRDANGVMVTSVTRCAIDGSQCVETLLAGGGADLVSPLVAIDRARAKIVVVASAGNIGFGGTATMFRCNLDASACVRTPLASPPKYEAKRLVVGDRIVLAGTFAGQSIDPPDDWKSLFVCDLDGTKCTSRAAIPDVAYDEMPSVVEETPDALYVAGRALRRVIERDVVVRHPHDGAAPTERDATLGPGRVSLADAIVDVKNAKLLTLSRGGGDLRPDGILSRCDLDGNACAAERVPDATALMGFAGDALIAGAERANLRRGGRHAWILRCAGDGTSCQALPSATSNGPVSFFFDRESSRAVMLRPDVVAIRACDLATSACGDWRQSGSYDGPAYPERDNAVVLGSDLVWRSRAGALVRCTDAGACTAVAPPVPSLLGWSRMAVSGGALYVVGSRVVDDGGMDLVKCSDDLTGCTRTMLVPAGGGHRIGDFSVAIDDARGRLVVAIDDELHLHRPTLVVCDLSGNGCREGEIANVAIRSPKVLIHPMNGDVLVVAENARRPRLFSVTLDR